MDGQYLPVEVKAMHTQSDKQVDLASLSHAPGVGATIPQRT